MANKRPPLTFPELEARGRRSILRSADEVKADAEMLAKQQTIIPANHHSSKPEDVAATLASRADYPKVTYRLRPEAVDAIEDAKRLLRRQYGIRVNLEEIAEAAILDAARDLEENKENSFLVRQFSGKLDRRRT